MQKFSSLFVLWFWKCNDECIWMIVLYSGYMLTSKNLGNAIKLALA